MNIMPIVFGSIIGVLWLVGCCILINKNSVKGKRTSKVILSVILFILCTGLYCGARIGAYVAGNAVRQYADLVEDYVKKNHSNVPMVRNGVEIQHLPQAINELEGMVPKLPDEFGLSGVFLVSFYQNAVSWGFNTLRSRSDNIISFADENNRITVTSIVQSVKWEINSFINRIVFWVTFSTAAILGIVLVIFIILLIVKIKNDKKPAVNKE